MSSLLLQILYEFLEVSTVLVCERNSFRKANRTFADVVIESLVLYNSTNDFLDRLL